MERINTHQANTGVKNRINKGSSPFMTPLFSQKRVESKIRNVPVPSSINSDESTAQPLSPPSSSLTFEQEQTSILERNEREERERTTIKYSRLAAKANNMGVFHERAGKVAKAMHCYQVALKAVREIKPSDGVISASKMCADVFPEEINRPIVIKIAEKNLSSEAPFIVLCILCNLGSLYRRSGSIGRSLEIFNIAYSAVEHRRNQLDEEEVEDESPENKLLNRVEIFIEKNVKAITDDEVEDDGKPRCKSPAVRAA